MKKNFVAETSRRRNEQAGTYFVFTLKQKWNFLVLRMGAGRRWWANRLWLLRSRSRCPFCE